MKSQTFGRQAPAFTLVELLVVIGIIGVLAAVILPAVNAAREAGRRTTCQNNMRQVALATLSYENQFNKLPAGRSKDNKHGFFIRILPNMEESTTADRYNFKLPWSDVNNRSAASQSIALLICPSVGEDREAISDFSPVLGVGANVHQALWQGRPRHSSQPSVSDPARLNGIILDVDERRSAKVTDGMSKTVLFAECSGRPQFYIREIAGQGAVPGRWAAPLSNLRVNVCSTVPAPAIPYPLESDGTPKKIPPSMINFINGFGSELQNQPGPEIYSFHSGGANLAFGDAAVRFISDTVSEEALLSILTAQDGDVVDDALLQ
jgi:prepilin-type N-terminal cleavage/methylation domain-containing protein/prepilin-type processing-associated H-X9-DG protein